MKTRTKIGIGVAFVLVGIQFVPTTRNISNTTPPADFVRQLHPPDNIANALHTACYNCHSNNTDYPWYNKVQPVAWLLAMHIRDGKEELNFSEFGKYSDRKKHSRFKMIGEQIEKDEMPLASYKLMHPEARLDSTIRKELIDYFRKLEGEYR